MTSGPQSPSTSERTKKPRFLRFVFPKDMTDAEIEIAVQVLNGQLPPDTRIR